MDSEDDFDLFKCMRCGNGALQYSGISTENEVDASIECTSCGASYPVRQGIPRFVTADNYAGSFGFQWNRHRQTQLDSHTGLPISRNRLLDVTRWPSRLDGQRVLEAGSGAGRFTEVLLNMGAQVYSFDYSSAVDANRANNGGNPNLHLFQGNIFDIPLREGRFDKVLCLGVIQHTPDPGAAFASLARQVRPGGELVIDVYTKRLRSILQWKYVLRPVTRRMNKERLYRMIRKAVPVLLPAAAHLRRMVGPIGARLLPILEYSHLNLPPSLNKEWAILDTFDMYSPTHDHPQSLATVRRWFESAGFAGIEVRYGPNGVVGRGTRR
jgi:SAM-dependent methyltransferase/DNA-directed RNA polymerase subunit RPC12/RpoP